MATSRYRVWGSGLWGLNSEQDLVRAELATQVLGFRSLGLSSSSTWLVPGAVHVHVPGAQHALRQRWRDPAAHGTLLRSAPQLQQRVSKSKSVQLQRGTTHCPVARLMRCTQHLFRCVISRETGHRCAMLTAAGLASLRTLTAARMGTLGGISEPIITGGGDAPKADALRSSGIWRPVP